MTVREARRIGATRLSRTSPSAPLDAEVLLAHTLAVTREALVAHDDRPVPPRALARYRRLIERRRNHEPVAYLIGTREFYGLRLAVDRRVLIPRPETEQLVLEAIKKIDISDLTHCVDVGTGSGAIAVAVATHAPGVRVVATDYSPGALTVAKRNAVIHRVADRIVFRRGDLLAPLLTDFRIYEKWRDILLVANLPYLTTEEWRHAPPDVRDYEPRLALDGGPDGLRAYDRLLDQLAARAPRVPVTLISEIGPPLRRSFPALVRRRFPHARMEIKNDLAGKARVAVVRIGP